MKIKIKDETQVSNHFRNFLKGRLLNLNYVDGLSGKEDYLSNYIWYQVDQLKRFENSLYQNLLVERENEIIPF